MTDGKFSREFPAKYHQLKYNLSSEGKNSLENFLSPVARVHPSSCFSFSIHCGRNSPSALDSVCSYPATRVSGYNSLIFLPFATKNGGDPFFCRR